MLRFSVSSSCRIHIRFLSRQRKLLHKLYSLRYTLSLVCPDNISPELCALAVTSLLVIKFGVLEPLSKHEIVINKVGRKLQRMSDETRDESFVMINLIKVFGSEKRHTDEFNDATRRQTEAVNRKVALRCIREWGYGVLRVMTYGLALYYATTVSTNLSPADLTSFFLIFGSFQVGLGDDAIRLLLLLVLLLLLLLLFVLLLLLLLLLSLVFRLCGKCYSYAFCSGPYIIAPILLRTM